MTETTNAGRAAEAQTLERTAELRRPLARAGQLARANGLGYAMFGALTIATSVGGDVAGLGLGAVLLAVGLHERRDGRALGSGDAGAPERLARGELALFVAIAAYCGFQILRPASDVSADLELLGEAAGIDAAELVMAVRGFVYFCVAVASLAYQGAMAMYFRRRRAAVDRYLRETPDWARDVIAAL